MANNRCIVCGQPGKPRECCAEKPVFCEDHDAEHRARVHNTAPSRSVDEALFETLQAEGFDEDR